MSFYVTDYISNDSTWRELSQPFTLSDVEVLFMEPRHILNLMKERVTTFLIVDLRDSDDFKESHIR